MKRRVVETSKPEGGFTDIEATGSSGPREAYTPTSCPCPMATAITSSRIPPRGKAGTSSAPAGVSTRSTSPRRTPRDSAVVWLISAQDCQATLVAGSGVSWSQGRLAPRPS